MIRYSIDRGSVHFARKGEYMVIDGSSARTVPEPVPPRKYPRACYGIVGKLALPRSTMIILVKDFKAVLQTKKGLVLQPSALEFVSIGKRSEYFESMAQSALDLDYLYYSQDFDITSKWESREKRDDFMWNHYMAKDIPLFTIRLICGFVGSFSSDFRYILLSRKHRKRVGTRYFSRGVDSEGNASNFVETEQIIEHSNKTEVFLQIRGSIPLEWEQVIDGRYRPKLNVKGRGGMDAHFEYLRQEYGDVALVSLINQHGYEGKIHTEFTREMQRQKEELVSFDFHQMAKADSNGLRKFVDGISSSMTERVVRTNCIDCLDRTNVVQSMLAFKKVGKEDGKFRNLWADHADAISTLYSGTGALKTDITRTGKRTFEGMVSDLSNSIVRYIRGNFLDGYRQDGLDLILGNCVPTEEQHRGGGAFLLFACSLAISTLPFYQADGILSFLRLSFAYSLALLMLLVLVVGYMGPSLVNIPSLVKLRPYSSK